MDARINLVFWLAGRKGKCIGYKQACRIAREFSMQELNRLFKLV